jgi:hypothetical protein
MGEIDQPPLSLPGEAMVCQLKELSAALDFAPPVSFRRLRLTPLRFRTPSDLEYLTCADADAGKWVTVEEMSAAGSVPQLRVNNRSEHRILIAEGSTLIGAKQNRVVNISVLLAPLSQTLIPVSCVERGRWRYDTPTFGLGAFSDCNLRAKMSAGVTASIKQFGKVIMDQGKVWAHVDSMLGQAKAASPTHAYQAVFDKCQDDIKDYESRLAAPAEACGVAVEIDEIVQAVDLFDKPETLHTLWPRLLKSYALAALHPRPAAGRKTDVKEFLRRALAVPAESFQAAGLGVSMRLASEEAVGAALYCDNQLVHLSLFASEPANGPTSEPPTLGQQPSAPTAQDSPDRPRRPWWRLGM